MYLKRLEVQGFKSFATRTAFEFGEGITAIVGPNGSGKSNIADALRWVLGEQSGRLLRARKLEDVIFAGSSQRPPAEKVEVTLTLDNSRAWLPLDFAEVAISRRGYRSGESDCFINRKRVRLRDLQELLLRASAPTGARLGAGQNSYAIIGQGLVETVLNLRPEERRQLIEEAADIQRYRLKIEEAQAKLAATRENTERVKLLLKEISPRLSRLERQAKRAAEHTRLSRELGQALQAWYDHHWHQAQEALAVARAAHDQAQAEQVQAKLAMETCQRELSSVGDELRRRRGAIAATASERKRLIRSLEEWEQRLAMARQRQGLLAARKEEAAAEVEATRKERAKAAETALAEEERRLQLQRGLEAARRDLDLRQRELAGLESEYRGMQANAAACEERASRARAAASDLRGRRQRLAHSRADLDKDIARLNTRRRSLIHQLAEVLRLVRSYRAQEADIAAEVAQVGQRRQALQEEVAGLRASLSSLEASRHGRRAKLEALQARLGVLREAQEQWEAAQAASPEAAPAIAVEGLQAVLSQIIRVPRGLEAAIDAALAENLEALIVDRQKDAIAAAWEVVDQRASRATFLPLDSLKSIHPLNLLKERGVVGVAARLVKYDPRFGKVVDALLGRTIIVQDVDTARRVLARGMGTVVTLDGIVFHPVGSITAGRPKPMQPSILGHHRDLETIPKEAERLQRLLAANDRELSSVRARLQEREAQLAGLSQEVDTIQERRLRVQEALAHHSQSLAHLRGELRGLISAQSRLREQEQAFLLESQRLQEEGDRLREEARQAQETARHLRRASALIQQRREGLLRAVSEASARVATLEGELRSLAGLRQGKESALARLDAQIAARQTQLDSLEQELSSLARGLSDDELGLAALRAELQSVSEGAEPQEETIAHLETRERDLHSQLLSAQNRLLAAERHVLETEAEVRRWETEVSTLRQRMEADGLAISEQGEVVAVPGVHVPIPYWLAAQGDQPDQPHTGPSGGLQPLAGGALIDPQALGQQIDKLRGQLRHLGPIDAEAQIEYQQLKDRHGFLSSQLADLQSAERSLLKAIDELSRLMQRRFQATFAQVAEQFARYFEAFFGGGRAQLLLSDGDNLNTAGVDIIAQPPGKRLQSLAQLSGGEKALTAVALLFALLQTSPSPFCVLDEVDAMLDDVNVGRFVEALQELAQRTQFIVITHNRKTIEVADAIYGISIGPDNTSRVLSLRLSEVGVN